jgi:3-oxoadipate enol-lactonase
MPTVTIGDIDIHYEFRGSGPAVLLIAGHSLDSRVWEPVAAALEQRATCVMPDSRGAGLSDVPRGPYSVNQMAGDLYGLLMTLGIDRAFVVGHSMGGYLALQLALDSPELVRGLTLVSTAAVGRRDALGMAPEARAALAHTRGSIEQIVGDNVRVSVSPGFLEQHPDRVERFIATRVERPPRGRGVIGQRAAADGFDVRDRLWEIGCPCTVIHGTDDRLISIERGRELAAAIEGAQLIELEGVGHLPQLEAPAELADAIGRAAGLSGAG